MAVVDFADVRPVPGVPDHARATHRIDPYWDGLWTTGSYATWVSRQTAEAQDAAGISSVPARWRMDPDEAWRILDGPVNRQAIISLLGAVMGWRTLTGQQAAAFTGYPAFASGSNILPAAFNARVMDVGAFRSGILRHTSSDPATLLRLSRNKVLERQFLPGCTLAERVAITGGREVTAGGQYDRHNLIAAELALRAAEMCDLGTVLPETLSTADLLLGTGLGWAPAVNRSGRPDMRAADVTFVRPDGLRIAVEITASPTPSFKQKVHRWAEALARSRLEETGLVVLFVAAAPHDRARGREVAGELRKTLTAILREYPGRVGARPGDRIFVAEWTDWFPARHQVDESFFSLRAELAPVDAGMGWRQVGLLSPFDLPFEPERPEAMAAVLRGAAALGSTPSWLRQDPWPLWGLPVVDLGVADLLAEVSSHSSGVTTASPPTPPVALTSAPFVSSSVAARPFDGTW